jgi:hypothetical protein
MMYFGVNTVTVFIIDSSSIVGILFGPKELIVGEGPSKADADSRSLHVFNREHGAAAYDAPGNATSSDATLILVLLGCRHSFLC